MKQLNLVLGLCIVAGIGSTTWSDSEMWRVRAYVDSLSQSCEVTSIELAMRSHTGEHLGKHRVVFSDGPHDAVWPIETSPGEVYLEVHRVDCGGVRGQVAQLTTTVTRTTERKSIYVAAVVHNGALDPRFVQVDTYANADDRLSARRDGSTIVLTNLGSDPVRLCNEASIHSVRDEYLINNKWIPSDEQHWSVPPEGPSIGPNDTLEIQPNKITVHRYVPPDAGTLVTPDAARVRVAIRPSNPTQIVLGDVPRAFLAFPTCDFLYVSRSVTDRDRLWPQQSTEK